MDDLLKLRSKMVSRLDPKYGKYLFVVVLGYYLITQFTNGTMYIMYYPSDAFPYRLLMVAGLLAFVKIMLFNRFADWKEFAVFLTLGLLILLGCIACQDWNFLYYYLLVVAAKDIDFKLIIKEFMIIIGTGLVLTFLSAKLGWIMGLTNSRDGSAEIRYALGTVYPTDLAARIFYLMLAYAMYKKFKFTLPEYVSLVSVTIWTYVVTDTRLDLGLMVLIITSGLFRDKIIALIKVLHVKWTSILSLIGIFSVIILTYLYQPNNLLFKIFNKLLSGRLEFGQVAFERYNVTLGGQMVAQNGNGGIHHGIFDYFFIDCSFLRVLMMNGMISFFILLFGIYYLTRRFMMQQTYVLEIALLLVILSSLLDHHLLEVSYNMLFLAFFANIDYFVGTKQK